MQAIRIEHVLLSLQPGGLENGVVNVINRIDRTRFRSSVCCLKEAGEFASRIEAPGVPVRAMQLRRGIDPLMALRLAAHFRRTRPHIVHTRNAESFFYGALAARLAGVPRVIHSEHGRTFTDRPIRFHAQRWLSRFANAIFAVSEQLKRDLVRHVGIPRTRIEVLYNGVDLQKFAAGHDRAAVRAELGFAHADVVVGSVGRLVPVKNYPMLLRAVAALQAPDVHVVLTGEGPERAALQDLARSLGIASRVRLLGHRDDVSRVLGAFDVFVLPSLSEGMSNTLLEAMARGVAPVVSDVGGNAEIVRDGVCGLVFPSDDVPALSSRLASLCSDPARRSALAASARARVTESFGMDAMIGRYERLYERVAHGVATC
jgi:sugar transferase (PEP-CTERM/EpsH1 system associated)